jgi:hypothetical protein
MKCLVKTYDWFTNKPFKINLQINTHNVSEGIDYLYIDLWDRKYVFDGESGGTTRDGEHMIGIHFSKEDDQEDKSIEIEFIGNDTKDVRFIGSMRKGVWNGLLIKDKVLFAGQKSKEIKFKKQHIVMKHQHKKPNKLILTLKKWYDKIVVFYLTSIKG